MPYVAPVRIRTHPAVAACEYGPDSGVMDYRHNVTLRTGWQFTRGRMAGCRHGHFKTVEDFRFANPQPTEG